MADLMRRDPFRDLFSLHSQLDDIFNDMIGRQAAPLSGMPTMDVYNEDDKQLIAEVHAPGFKPDDIDVRVHNGVLEIKGEKHDSQEEKGKKRNYMMRESSASFYRRIALPKQADGDAVQAHFDNGLLTVTVPFKELPEPKRIQIQSGSSKK